MPHYAVVVEHPQEHLRAHVERHAQAKSSLRSRRGLAPETVARMRAIYVREAARTEPIKGAGDLHTSADSECPLGLPNCRNCGDPAHAAACRAAGHCQLCGTAHGIAPDAYLAASGVSLVEVPEDLVSAERRVRPGHAWDPALRKFVKRG